MTTPREDNSLDRRGPPSVALTSVAPPIPPQSLVQPRIESENGETFAVFNGQRVLLSTAFSEAICMGSGNQLDVRPMRCVPPARSVGRLEACRQTLQNFVMDRPHEGLPLKPFSTISNHSKNCVVSLIGMAGSGKSTLGSAILSTMRRTPAVNYFRASHGAESFTKGLWYLNEGTKVAHAERDIFDVIDLEGLVSVNDTFHLSPYFIVIGLVLSTALLVVHRQTRLCDLAPILDQVGVGISVCKEYDLPIRPVVYIPNNFKLDNGQPMPFDHVVEQLAKLTPTARVVELRPYILRGDPSDEGSRYYGDVRSLVDKLELELRPNVADGEPIVKRCEYAANVMVALNRQDHALAQGARRALLDYRIEDIRATSMEDEKKILRTRLSAVNYSAGLTYAAFVGLLTIDCKGVVLEQVQACSYYRSADDTSIETKLEQLGGCSFLIGNYCKPMYLQKKAVFEAEQADLAKQRKADSDRLRDVVAHENSMFRIMLRQRHRAHVISLLITAANRDIPFNANDKNIPLSVKREIDQARETCIKESGDRGELGEPLDLETDVSAEWNNQVAQLEARWALQITRAAKKNRVSVTGTSRCGFCGTDHELGCVVHKRCGGTSLMYWVDGPTKNAICDGCSQIKVMDTVECHTCARVMSNLRIVIHTSDI